MKTLVDKTRHEAQGYKERVEELQEEKADLLRDIAYLETKISAALKKINAYAKEINILKGERHIHRERLSKLEKGYRDCMEERDSLINRTIE
jgi:predicted nuclease with TOPRIM domain